MRCARSFRRATRATACICSARRREYICAEAQCSEGKYNFAFEFEIKILGARASRCASFTAAAGAAVGREK